MERPSVPALGVARVRRGVNSRCLRPWPFRRENWAGGGLVAAWPGRFNGIVGLPDCRQDGRLPGMRQVANRILVVDDS